jgi:hypothetical protein
MNGEQGVTSQLFAGASDAAPGCKSRLEYGLGLHEHAYWHAPRRASEPRRRQDECASLIVSRGGRGAAITARFDALGDLLCSVAKSRLRVRIAHAAALLL